MRMDAHVMYYGQVAVPQMRFIIEFFSTAPRLWMPSWFIATIAVGERKQDLIGVPCWSPRWDKTMPSLSTSNNAGAHSFVKILSLPSSWLTLYHV